MIIAVTELSAGNNQVANVGDFIREGCRAVSRETARPAVAEKLCAYYADPANKKRYIERMARPSTRAKISEHTKAAMARPEVRQKQQDGARRAWNDPAKRAAQAVLTRERRAVWKAERLTAAAAVLSQMPSAERDEALAAMARIASCRSPT